VEFILTGEMGERRRFLEEFENFCRQSCVPDSARQAADLALEEHLTNVFNYGFTSGDKSWIRVRLRVSDNALHVNITDTGKAYDPLCAPLADTSIPLEDKQIGGLGVHLMKEFMDELSYEREGRMNVLRMIKEFGANMPSSKRNGR
jgi:serine/threonine-protein kinase RsbW